MRRGSVLCIAALLLLPLGTLSAQKLPKADRIPAVPTAAQRQLIAEGVRLHDQGEYESAIAKYQQVLDEAPDVVEAMYESSFTLSDMNQYEKSLTFSRRGAQYRSRLLWQFHMMIGNVLDDMGKSQEAIDVFKAAIKQSPRAELLHYNLGLALVRNEKFPDAKKSLQQALYLNPQHASSHLLLAQVYDRMGYRVPAILALSRFLSVEPSTPRSKGGVEALGRLLSAGVSTDSKSSEITILLALPSSAKKDEGDFGTAEFGLSITAAAAHLGKESQGLPFKQWTSTYAVLAENLAEVNGNGFAARYYAPFFVQMDGRGLIESFVHRMFSAAPLEGAEIWRSENPGKSREYEAWLSEYQWPAPR